MILICTLPDLIRQNFPVQLPKHILMQSILKQNDYCALIRCAVWFCPRQLVKLLGGKRAEYVTVFCGEDVKRRKPAPDVYQLAQIKFGANPEDCVVFEDKSVGLQAAKAAGMLCVISKSTYTAGEIFFEADAVVDDLESGEINLERLAGMAFNMQGLNA